MRTCAYQGVKNVRFFRKIWRAFFFWNTRFEIRPFALLPTSFKDHGWQNEKPRQGVLRETSVKFILFIGKQLMKSILIEYVICHQEVF